MNAEMGCVWELSALSVFDEGDFWPPGCSCWRCFSLWCVSRDLLLLVPSGSSFASLTFSTTTSASFSINLAISLSSDVLASDDKRLPKVSTILVNRRWNGSSVSRVRNSAAEKRYESSVSSKSMSTTGAISMDSFVRGFIAAEGKVKDFDDLIALEPLSLPSRLLLTGRWFDSSAISPALSAESGLSRTAKSLMKSAVLVFVDVFPIL